MSDELAKRFHREVLDGYQVLKKECKYNANYFIQMVQERGAVQAAKDLVRASREKFSDGLVTLWECGRLDLSIEQMVQDERWRPLFTDEEREIARETLGKLRQGG